MPSDDDSFFYDGVDGQKCLVGFSALKKFVHAGGFKLAISARTRKVKERRVWEIAFSVAVGCKLL